MTHRKERAMEKMEQPRWRTFGGKRFKLDSSVHSKKIAQGIAEGARELGLKVRITERKGWSVPFMYDVWSRR